MATPETFTSGRVSAAARRSWQAMRPRDVLPDRFDACPRGYMMYGWESELAMARAMGRGDASGRGRSPHQYDREDC